ncbi:hypothetical protein RRG08_059866 [Elysia crispata]|uniref:Uncharacterized protein n=1 Tax=Elysia crispata TaxID=231223 RepID=A0AAE1B314_9GAST|nr:hypothetical protein RRG08_059866 [Elysia crispata]
MRPPEHHKWRATDMSDKLHIEFAAARAPQVAGNRYVRQASHRARGHQSTTSGGQQIYMSDILDIEHAATRAPQVAGNRYVIQASHRARGQQSTTRGGQQICHTSLT